MPTHSVPVLQSLFPPGPNDAALAQSKFFVDSAQLLPDLDQPGATALMMEGSLPTPCNQLRVQLSGPDTENRIRVNVYSVIEKDKICTQVLEPFEGKTAVIDGLPAGTYPVLVNSQPIGEIQAP